MVYDDVSAVNNALGDSLQYPICVMRLSSSASVASMAITAICSVYDLVWPRAKLLGEGVFVWSRLAVFRQLDPRASSFGEKGTWSRQGMIATRGETGCIRRLNRLPAGRTVGKGDWRALCLHSAKTIRA